MEFTFRDSKVLSNGADGGHRYLSGICNWQGEPVKVYAFMVNKDEESRLMDGVTCIEGEVDIFIDGAGLMLRNCRSISPK